MPKRKVTLTARIKGPPRRRTKARQLVWVDQRPLRRQAASECGRAMERLEKARREWKRYEREDQPAYQRWMASTFGALMSRVRELEARVREKEALVRDVEREMHLSGSSSYRAAYATVQRRRAHPEATPPPRSEKNARFQDEEELSEFEQELLFEEFLRTFLGLNPDRMSDRQYARMFADFKTKLLGQNRPEPPPEPEPEPNLAPEPPPSGQNRVKELYRLLVRRLHPDMRADNNSEVSAIWHDVQEAYATGNVERLEMLLAFTDIQSNTAGEHTSLFQMRSVLAELRRAFTALQRTLRTARKDRAWNFARRKDRSALESRVRREMESTLDWNENQLRELEALIAQWSAPPKNSSPRSTKPRQAEFFY